MRGEAFCPAPCDRPASRKTQMPVQRVQPLHRHCVPVPGGSGSEQHGTHRSSPSVHVLRQAPLLASYRCTKQSVPMLNYPQCAIAPSGALKPLVPSARTPRHADCASPLEQPPSKLMHVHGLTSRSRPALMTKSRERSARPCVTSRAVRAWVSVGPPGLPHRQVERGTRATVLRAHGRRARRSAVACAYRAFP
jgi:hypothetical protein